MAIRRGRQVSNRTAPIVAPTAGAPQAAPKGAPGQAAPGAPPVGQTGNVAIHGGTYPVNAAGIVAEGPYKGMYPVQALNGPAKGGTPTTPPPAPGSGGGTGQPGASVPGAPPRGTPGSVTVNGQTVKVNAAGIIETPGPYYGKYPAQVNRNLVGEAATSVNAELLPRINEIARRQAEETSRANDATGDLTQRGEREVANIGELYARLSNFQGAVRDDSNQAFNQSKANTGTAYDQLAAGLNKAYDGAEQAGNAEANRLGLGGMNANATAAGNRDQQYLTQLANVDKQAQLGATDNMQNGFSNLLGKMQQNAGQESAGAQTAAARQTNKAISDIMRELQYGMRDLDGQRSDIEATRGSRIADFARMLEDQQYGRNQEQSALERALEEQQYSRQREQSADAFSRQLAEKNFGLDAAGQQFSQNLQQQQQQFAMQPAPTSELDMLRAVNELMELNGTGSSSPYYQPAPAYTPGTLAPPRNPGSTNSPTGRPGGSNRGLR